MPNANDTLLKTIRRVVGNMLDPESDHIDTSEAVEMASAFRKLDIDLSNGGDAPLPWTDLTRAHDVHKHMLSVASEHRDECDDINCTTLAEATAQALDLYVPDDSGDIPQALFDAATLHAEASPSEIMAIVHGLPR